MISPDNSNYILLYDEVLKYNKETKEYETKKTFECKTTFGEIIYYILSLISIGDG